MTDNTDKLRAVFLTALMVFSVFAGTIAFAGSAVGSNHADVSIDDQVSSGDEVTVSAASNASYPATLVVWNADTSAVLNRTNITGDVTDFTVDVAVADGDSINASIYDGALQSDPSDISNAAAVSDDVTVTVPTFPTNGTQVFAGAPVYFDTDGDNNGGGSYSLYSGTAGDDGSFETNLDVNDNGVITVNTAGRSGDYFISNQGDDTADLSFSVASQDFSAAWAEDSVETGNSVDLELSSNSNDYNVLISSDDLSNSDLDSVFPGSTNSDGEISHAVDATSYAISGDFANIAAGNYTVDVEVVETGATASATITVNAAGDASASFANPIVSVDRGDIARITVDVANDDTISGFIGTDSVNYVASFTATDEDEDGQVTILFNTYMSGDASTAISAAGDDTASGTQEVGGGSVFEAGDYDLNVTATSGEDDVGTLIVEERSSGSASTSTAPASLDTGSADRATLLAATNAGSSVTYDDVAVATFSDVSGLEGFFNDSDVNNNNGLNITISQVDAGPNADEKSFNANAGLGNNVSVLGDLSNDTFYVMWMPDSGIATGDWEVTYTLEGEYNDAVANSDTSGPEDSITATFTVASTSVELNGGDTWTADTLADQTVEGETSLAPGTEFTVRARATGNNPFLKTASAEVQQGGTFSATFDLSDVPNGTEFTVRVQGYSSSEIDAVAIEGSSEEPTTETPEPTPTPTPEPTTEEPTPTPTPEPTTEDTPEPTTEDTPEPTTEETTTTDSGGQPGFGVAVALIAVIAAALLALRRRD